MVEISNIAFEKNLNLKRSFYTIKYAEADLQIQKSVFDINLFSELSAKNNKSVVITPDGPRGPLFAVKNGALIVSKECHIPIIPVRINYANKFVLSKSWDKFEIPYPFTKCDVHFGNQYFYNEFLEEKELADFKNILSNEMS